MDNGIMKKLAAVANKFSGFRVVRALTDGFRFAMPVLFVGAIFQIVSNVAMGASGGQVTEIVGKINVLKDLTFGILGLVFAYGIGHASARTNKINPNTAGILSLSLFLILCKPEFTPIDMMTTQFSVNFSKFGVNGMTLAMVAGLTVGEISALFINKGWTISGKNLPSFIKNWFEPIIPGVIVLSLGWAVTYLLNIDLYEWIAGVLQPLLNVSDTLPAMVALWVFSTFIFTLGVHPLAVIGPILPLLFAPLGENAQLAQSGLAPIVANGFHINNIATVFSWAIIGGTGATLGLNIWMLRSKSNTIKSLGKASLVPSILNINEPLIFGAPIVFNPVLAIPFILVGGVINQVIVYLSMSLGLNNIPFNMFFVPFVPIGISGFLSNNDWRGIIVTALIVVVDLIVWYPFFKLYEKQTLEEEEKEKKK